MAAYYLNASVDIWSISDGAANTALTTVLNSGVVLGVGTSNLVNTVAQGSSRGSTRFNTQVVELANYTSGALSAGTFANVNQTGIVMRSTKRIAGTNSDELVSGSSDRGRAKIHRFNAGGSFPLTTTSLRTTGRWNSVSGVWAAGYPEPGSTGAFDAYDGAGTDQTLDKEANVTPGVYQGSLAYLGSGVAAVTGNFPVQYG
jgi:hypothetical protein